MRALAIAEALGARPGGAFVGKLFMSEDFTRARDALRALFEEVKVIRPEGTRSQSFEVFLAGLRRKPPAAP
jgi:23S rRNA (uridine2552-2'-O)-methyltransferase